MNSATGCEATRPAATVSCASRSSSANLPSRSPSSAFTGLEIQDSLTRIRADALGLSVILLSGSIGEEAAVDLLEQGALDSVLKDRLARLVPAIESDLREALERMQLRLLYQPLVDQHTARISGYQSVGTVHG